jgi:hypothetical protein
MTKRRKVIKLSFLHGLPKDDPSLKRYGSYTDQLRDIYGTSTAYPYLCQGISSGLNRMIIVRVSGKGAVILVESDGGNDGKKPVLINLTVVILLLF